ncbi:unnamed protein product [Phyllotreta striolata]|uniref:GSKIP domain-containing protein n=1 Tax=Phyllotreta striolata TaxID=444603 RepID=A0A9N9XN31_PHYSR|nr:unnamed protein product [Phyllotreta striolata]
MSEHLLDSENWKLEAEAVIKDVRDHVKTLIVCEKLTSNNSRVYLNLVTNEERTFCVELSALGFRIVGNKFDTNDLNSEEYFETPYSLLDTISLSYKDSFAGALQKKLETLRKHLSKSYDLTCDPALPTEFFVEASYLSLLLFFMKEDL